MDRVRFPGSGRLRTKSKLQWLRTSHAAWGQSGAKGPLWTKYNELFHNLLTKATKDQPAMVRRNEWLRGGRKWTIENGQLKMKN
jgi:hypothetical protein